MNSFLLILSAAAGVPAQTILNALRAGAAAVPDAAPEINAVIAKIEQPLDAANIADVLKLLPAEIRDIFAGHFNPREHPSDAG